MPRFETLRLAEGAVVHERREPRVPHLVQPVAPNRPACLLCGAAADTHLQHDGSAGRQIDRTVIIYDGEAVGDDFDKLHGTLLRRRPQCKNIARANPSENDGWLPRERRHFG
ncbi:MAG: hypothetical protein EXQ59_06165 [Acidobacteria bacterium]|nr:hypothetical protein [Acidobacteriota bacterium]